MVESDAEAARDGLLCPEEKENVGGASTLDTHAENDEIQLKPLHETQQAEEPSLLNGTHSPLSRSNALSIQSDNDSYHGSDDDIPDINFD